MKYTATLENWTIVGVGKGRTVASGNIVGDTRHRWPDDTRINTSLIVEHNEEEGHIITLNSVYKLGQPG